MVVVVVTGWQMAPLLSFAQSAVTAGLQGLRRPADLTACSQASTTFHRDCGATPWLQLEMCKLSLPSEDLHSSPNTKWRSSLLFCISDSWIHLVDCCGIFSLPQLAGCNGLISQGAGWWVLLMDYNTLAVRDFVSASTQLSPRDRIGDLLKADLTGSRCCKSCHQIMNRSSDMFDGSSCLQLCVTQLACQNLGKC